MGRGKVGRSYREGWPQRETRGDWKAKSTERTWEVRLPHRGRWQSCQPVSQSSGLDQSPRLGSR